mmetsp:Transcript_28957/g.49464  ORF Transcript_28957/g.49464 Transcript_28957/m.49464 type:complete len:287 (+) Transcript_28957:308-1168(+)
MAAVAAATAAVAASAAHVETTVAGTTTAVATMTAATTGTVATTGTAVTTAIVTATGTATATAATTATVTAVAATTPIRTTTTVASASRRRRTGARTRRTRTARRRRRSARASMTMTAMTSMTRRKRSQAAGTPLTTNATDRRNAMTTATATATATATVTVTVTERTWLGRCRRLNERDESCCRRIGLDPSHVSGGVVGRVAVCARCAACGCGWRPGEHAATLLATHMPPKNQPLGGCRFGPARLQLPSVHTRNTSCFNSCAREAAARASDRLRTTRRLYTVAYAVS